MIERGEFRYGGNCVMIGIGVYADVTRRISRSSRKRSRVHTIVRRELVDVLPLSGLYDYSVMGWKESHDAAVKEASSRGWKEIVY